MIEKAKKQFKAQKNKAILAAGLAGVGGSGYTGIDWLHDKFKEAEIRDADEHSYYAFRNITEALQDTNSDTDIIIAVNSWIERRDSSRISGLQTVCYLSRNKLHSLMQKETANIVCRKVRETRGYK